MKCGCARGAAAHNPQQFILHCCGRQINKTKTTHSTNLRKANFIFFCFAGVVDGLAASLPFVGAPLHEINSHRFLFSSFLFNSFRKRGALKERLISLRSLFNWLGCLAWFSSFGGAIGGATAHNPPKKDKPNPTGLACSIQSTLLINGRRSTTSLH